MNLSRTVPGHLQRGDGGRKRGRKKNDFLRIKKSGGKGGGECVESLLDRLGTEFHFNLFFRNFEKWLPFFFKFFRSFF